MSLRKNWKKWELSLSCSKTLPYNSGVDIGRVAQLVRAFGSHPKGHGFESCSAH